MDNRSTLDQKIYNECKACESQFYKDWEAVVNIDSPSRYGDGLSKVGNYVAQKLRALGAKVEIHPVKNDDEGFNVVGTFTGNGKGNILLLAHMDTVLPVGSAAKRPFRIDCDGKAYGPGVSDDKSGVVQCLHAMKILQDTGFHDYGKITFLANCQEESGSSSSRNLIMKLAKEHDCALCTEPGAPGDGICINRAGYATLTTEVKGVSSHTAYPWLGRNAAEELAHQVLNLIRLADKEKGTVISTKIIESGIENKDKCVAPDYGKAIMDIYAYTNEEMARVEKAAAELSKATYISGIDVKSTFELEFPPFVKSDNVLNLAKLAQKIYSDLGKNLNTVSGAAATDAGWVSAVNDTVVCSLGPVSGGKNHSEEEWADAKTVVPRLYLLVKMLMELGAQGSK
jgi:Acetylornithine deacetylase/Succinyl-diaminopimelate desuccinylase and related deacylases